MPATRLAARVIARLAQAEVEELNPHYRDDLRIARLTAAYATSGEAVLCSPHVLASYMVLGLHPEKVWPAMQARRQALVGPWCEVSEVTRGSRSDDLRRTGCVDLCQALADPLVGYPAPVVPSFGTKKSAQSVKLWAEKTKGARAVNSRAAIENGSPRTISVPMAAAPIAALYTKSDAPSSAKTRQYTYDEMVAIVEFSGAPHSIRQGTLSALKARGPWPKEDGPAHGVICVSLIGMQLHGVCCRSTARWRTRRAVRLGYWRQLRKANAWSNCPKCGAERVIGKCGKFDDCGKFVKGCGYEGRAKTPEGKANFDEFCRPYMYEIDIEKFRSAQRPKEIRYFDARTYAEYKAAAKRGEHPNVTEMPSPKQPESAPPPKSPAPARPAEPRRKAAETDNERKPLEITRDVRIAIAGCYSNARKQGKDDEAAIAEVSELLSSERYYLAPSEARLQLKIWQSKHGSLDAPVKQERVEPAKCPRCQSVLMQNRGPGPRLICPNCAANSS